MFGDDIYTDEIFMAYYYARYVGGLCETARKYTQIPLYVNAALNSRGRLWTISICRSSSTSY